MANKMRDAIKGNDHSDIRKIAEAGDAALAAAILGNTEPANTVTTTDSANLYPGVTKNVEAFLANLPGAGRTTETIKGNNTLILANTASIDALQRTGSTVVANGAVTDAARDVVLTVKDGDGTAVAKYAMIGVKVTLGNGSGVDTGNPAIIATGLTTIDGLIVKSGGGEQLSPSNGAAISDTRPASLIAYSLATGVLTVTAKTAVNNTYIFVHFIMPDGTVESSTEIKLKEV